MAAASVDGDLPPPRWRHWVALAVYPLLSFFSPSEAYLFQYLTTVKGFSARQVIVHVFPWWSYSLPACLLLVVALGRIGHKRTVVLGGIARLSAAAIVVVVPAGNVRLMQLDQVCFALFFAAKTAALPALLFDVFEPREYQRALALVRGCVLLGSASSAFCGQLLVARGAPLETLVRATFCCHLGGLAASLALPATRALDRPLAQPSARASVRGTVASLRRALGAPRLRALLLWHVGLVAVQQLVLTYYQPLFASLASAATAAGLDAHALLRLPPSGRVLRDTGWNGSVVGLADLAGSFASFAAGHARVERCARRRLRAVAAGTSALAALLLGVLGGGALAPAWAPSLPAAYVCFVGAQTLFEFGRTVGVAQLAIGLEARGCRRFLSALVGCQLCVCVAQVFLQACIQAISNEPSRQFHVLALACATTALCLAVGACWDRGGAQTSVWKPPVDRQSLVDWAPAAADGADDGAAPWLADVPSANPIVALIVDENRGGADSACAGAPVLLSEEAMSVCACAGSTSSRVLPSDERQSRDHEHQRHILAQPSSFPAGSA